MNQINSFLLNLSLELQMQTRSKIVLFKKTTCKQWTCSVASFKLLWYIILPLACLDSLIILNLHATTLIFNGHKDPYQNIATFPHSDTEFTWTIDYFLPMFIALEVPMQLVGSTLHNCNVCTSI